MITNTQPNLFDAKTGNSYNRVLVAGRLIKRILIIKTK